MIEYLFEVITILGTFIFTGFIVCGGSGLFIAGVVMISSYLNDHRLKSNVERRRMDVSKSNKK